MPQPKLREKQRALDTTPAEAQVLDAIQETIGQSNLQAIESGFRIDEKEYLSRVDAEVGFWTAKHRRKVSRVLIHILPTGDGYELEFPAQDLSRHLGVQILRRGLTRRLV
jgi:hypothetical protein